MWECGLKHCRRTHAGMDMLVTPYVGVWIETYLNIAEPKRLLSLLMWECGLKPCSVKLGCHRFQVTPYVGVWIETSLPPMLCVCTRVTPYVGVWIETLSLYHNN